MQKIVEKLDKLLAKTSNTIKNSSEEYLKHKPSVEKWSKKELLGHLIDSAINNLQRFTEIQFENKPYKIRKYNQDELVKVNNYNQIPAEQLLNLWLALNQQISSVIQLQTESTLSYEIEFSDGNISDLKFLINDYVNHLEHHVIQIIDKESVNPIEIKKVNLDEKFSSFTEYWTPKIVGELNNQFVKIAKFKGEFVMHKHEQEDELFYVTKGQLFIELKDKTLQINQGEFVIIPKGIEHKPYSLQEVEVVLFEPASTLNTGNQTNELTVNKLEKL